jgi:hypothetical protein
LHGKQPQKNILPEGAELAGYWWDAGLTFPEKALTTEGTERHGENPPRASVSSVVEFL